jgi:hypothetical protein
MKVKFDGEWCEIRFIRTDGMNFDIDPIYCDHEKYIEDVEINGRHLAHLNNEASKTEAAKQQNDKPTEKAGREENFPTNTGCKFVPGDRVRVSYGNRRAYGIVKRVDEEGFAEVDILDDNATIIRGLNELTKVTDDEKNKALCRRCQASQNQVNQCWEVGDEVMTIDQGGDIFRGTIADIFDSGLCRVMSVDGNNNLTGVPLSDLVDNSADANPTYSAWRITTLQMGYWKKKALHQSIPPLLDVIPTPPTDWEGRRWALACHVLTSNLLEPRTVLECVDKFIEAYRKESDENSTPTEAPHKCK